MSKYTAKRITVPLLVISLAILVLISSSNPSVAGKISPPLPAIEASKGAPEIRVLFVGSQMMGNNDLPGIFSNVAATDTSKPLKASVGRFMGEDHSLEDLWSENWAQKSPPLKDGHWDYVILQEDVANLVMQGGEYKAERGLIWSSAAKALGAKVLYLQPWSIQRGSPGYKTKTLAKYDTPEKLQARIDQVIGNLAANNKTEIVALGDSWQKCLAHDENALLYDTDAISPSLTGNYLNALLLYKRITGHDVEHVSYNPGITEAEVKWAKACASK